MCSAGVIHARAFDRSRLVERPNNRTRERLRLRRRGSEIELDPLTCKDVILEFLADSLDNSLGPEVTAALERHLANCKACVAYLNTYRRTRELTSRMAPPAMPEEMKTHLRQLLLERLAGTSL